MVLGRALATPQTGERLALDAVYREHAEAVKRWALRLGGPALDAEDVAHEVFLVAHRRLHEFRGDAKLATWLYRVTLRVVRKQARRQKIFALPFSQAVVVSYQLPPQGMVAAERPTGNPGLSWRRKVGATVLVVAGVTAVAGVGLAASGRQLSREAAAASQASTVTLNERIDGRNRQIKLAFAVAGTAGVMGALLWLWPEGSQGTRPYAVAGSGVGVVGVRHSF